MFSECAEGHFGGRKGQMVLGSEMENPQIFPLEDAIFGSGKSDPVQFKRGFGQGTFKRQIYSLLKVLCLRGEELLAKTPVLPRKKTPVLKPLVNWTGSVLPLLRLVTRERSQKLRVTRFANFGVHVLGLSFLPYVICLVLCSQPAPWLHLHIFHMPGCSSQKLRGQASSFGFRSQAPKHCCC